jgi:hypothetical protein
MYRKANMTMENIFNNQQEAGSCSFFESKTPRKQEHEEQDAHDAELAKEMNELSVQEREKVLDDIHGVAQAHEETPEFVASCLEELDARISQIPKVKRRAHSRALFFKPTIQNDAKFKLMFLRADVYDAEKAAKRMIKYYEDKLELFGEEKLAKDITLDDLTEEDMDVYSTGWCLELPHKDQVGRPIWFFDLTRYDFDRPNSMVSDHDACGFLERENVLYVYTPRATDTISLQPCWPTNNQFSRQL